MVVLKRVLMKVVFPNPLSPTTIIVKAAPLSKASSQHMHNASKRVAASSSDTPLRNDLVPLVGEVGDADELVDVCGDHLEDSCFVCCMYVQARVTIGSIDFRGDERNED